MPCHQIRSAHLLQFIMPTVLTKTMIMGHNNGNNSDSSNSKIKIHNSKPFNSILCLDQISASAPAYNADPADSGRSLFTLHTHTGWLKGFLVPLIESAIVSTPITRKIFALCVDQQRENKPPQAKPS